MGPVGRKRGVRCRGDWGGLRPRKEEVHRVFAFEGSDRL